MVATLTDVVNVLRGEVEELAKMLARHKLVEGGDMERKGIQSGREFSDQDLDGKQRISLPRYT